GAPITLHLARPAAAFAFEVAEITARTRVHRRDEHQFTRKRDAARGARHRHLAVLERLAHHFERRAFELRQLIEKEHTIVRETHFAGIRKRAAAEQADVTDGVMRRTKG